MIARRGFVIVRAVAAHAHARGAQRVNGAEEQGAVCPVVPLAENMQLHHVVQPPRLIAGMGFVFAQHLVKGDIGFMLAASRGLAYRHAQRQQGALKQFFHAYFCAFSNSA